MIPSSFPEYVTTVVCVSPSSDYQNKRPNAGIVENELEGSEVSATSHDDDTVEIENAVDEQEVIEDAPDLDVVDEEENDILANDEMYESSKALIITKYNEEAKTLRKENQKLILDR